MVPSRISDCQLWLFSNAVHIYQLGWCAHCTVTLPLHYSIQYAHMAPCPTWYFSTNKQTVATTYKSAIAYYILGILSTNLDYFSMFRRNPETISLTRSSFSQYYVTENQRFDTINKLIDYHSKYTDGLPCQLLFPAPKRAQATVFGVGENDSADVWEIDRTEIMMKHQLGGSFVLLKYSTRLVLG